MILHRHKFTVPLELAYQDFRPRYDGSGHVTISPSYAVVTKLGCICGATQPKDGRKS